MSDAKEFLNAYQEMLDNEIREADWPTEIRDRYCFESCLKHDEQKEVYLVRDRYTDIRMVLRITSADAGSQADTEWEILSQLNHPGIPRVFDRLTVGNKSFTTREYIPGQPLDAVVAQRLLTPSEIFSITRLMCDILTYQHCQAPPIIHRDIKPQNIILRPDGSIALTDFGISRTFKPWADSDTQFVGTMPYAPPEQYGYAQSTPQTDLYALGIVLVYLATGSPNRQNLKERIADKKLLDLINHCIAFDPADRFSSSEEVCHFIEKGRRFKPTSKQLASKRLSRITLGAITAGLFLVLVAFGVFVWADPLGWIASLTGSNTQGMHNEESPNNTEDVLAIPVGEGPLFDSSIRGNLVGNITNGGLAVESESTVYVALTEGIYELAPDGSRGQEIIGVREANSLNYYQGRLYFYSYSIGGLGCVDLETGQSHVLAKVRVERFYIENNTIYFVNIDDHYNLYAIDVEGTNMRKIDDHGGTVNRELIIYDGYQYFAEDLNNNYYISRQSGHRRGGTDFRRIC